LGLGSEKIVHFVGLACVNIDFYTSESISKKFDPQNKLQE